MSGGFFPAPEDICKDPDLGPSAAVLYGRIWRYCQGGGTCYASYATLADECGVGQRTIQRWLFALRSARYITIKSGKEGGTTNVIATTRRWVMGEDSGSAKMAHGVGQNGRGGKPKRLTRVSQNGLRLKEVEEKREEKRETSSSPFGVVVVPSPAPALPDHDDDSRAAAQHGSAGHHDLEALDTITAILAPIPCRSAATRARTVLAAIRRSAPDADAAAIQAAADGWTDRMERSKGHAPDPLTASQIPAVVAAHTAAELAALATGRGGHRLIPMIER